jgi:DNA-binding GntR family transcriptional regulator
MTRSGRPRTRRPQLSEEVAAHLRDLILSGTIRPGEFIRVEEIAAQLGVALTPVREALFILRGEDMVELEPRRGYVVAPLSRQDVEDLLRLQADLAGEFAARAAATITPADLAGLEEVQLRLSEAVGLGRPEDVEQLEAEFHRMINLVAGARKLSWFLQAATRYTAPRVYSCDQGWRSAMLIEHRALLVAFAERDVAAVRAGMIRHTSDGADRVIKNLAQIGFWAP